MTVCLFQNYGHKLLIDIKFGNNVLGTKAIDVYVGILLFPSHFIMAAVCRVFFAITGVKRGLLFTDLLPSHIQYEQL